MGNDTYCGKNWIWFYIWLHVVLLDLNLIQSHISTNSWLGHELAKSDLKGCLAKLLFEGLWDLFKSLYWNVTFEHSTWHWFTSITFTRRQKSLCKYWIGETYNTLKFPKKLSLETWFRYVMMNILSIKHVLFCKRLDFWTKLRCWIDKHSYKISRNKWGVLLTLVVFCFDIHRWVIVHTLLIDR